MPVILECTLTHEGIRDQFPHRHDDGQLYARCVGVNCAVSGHSHPAQFMGYGPQNPRPRRRRRRRPTYSPPEIDPDTGEPSY